MLCNYRKRVGGEVMTAKEKAQGLIENTLTAIFCDTGSISERI